MFMQKYADIISLSYTLDLNIFIQQVSQRALQMLAGIDPNRAVEDAIRHCRRSLFLQSDKTLKGTVHQQNIIY